MRFALLLGLSPLVVTAALAAEGQKYDFTTDNFRKQCHAHLFYTIAVAAEDDKTRLAFLNKAIEFDPKLWRALYNRGVLHVKMNDLPLARADFKKVLALREGHLYSHYNLACIESMDSQLDAALVSLENALKNGYQKFDKIPNDPDLKNLQANPAFAMLIAKYKALAATNPPDIFQRFQMGTVEERAAILDESVDGPVEQATILAEWAMNEPDFQLRTISMHFWRKLNVAKSKPALVQGLYDSNGYVKKAAANALVSYGKEIEELAVWAIEDLETEAPFYAMQILALIDARASADKIVPILRHKDYKCRYLAAEALAKLGAVSAIPQIEAALKDLPKDESDQGIYKALIERSLAVLREAKASEDN